MTLCELCSVDYIPDVFLVGYLYTERLFCNHGNNNEICLDMNNYFGKTDYELEIEFIDTIDKQILHILKSLEIEINSSIIGKYGRFMKRYEMLNQQDYEVTL